MTTIGRCGEKSSLTMTYIVVIIFNFISGKTIYNIQKRKKILYKKTGTIFQGARPLITSHDDGIIRLKCDKFGEENSELMVRRFFFLTFSPCP